MKYSPIHFKGFQILFLFYCLAAKAQDTIVFKSGARELTKVLEISTSQVRYKNYLNLEGPDYIVESSTLFEIRFSNGTVEKIFATKNPTISQWDTLEMNNGKKYAGTVKQMHAGFVAFMPEGSPKIYNKNVHTIRKIITAKGISYVFRKNKWMEEGKYEQLEAKGLIRPYQLGDFVQLNLYTGLVLNKAHCNIPYVTIDRYTNGYEPSENESVNESKNQPYFMRYTAGLDMQFYSSPYIKPILSFNYLESEGMFQYYYYERKSDFNKPSTSIEGTAYSIVRYINISTGFRTILFHHLNIDLCNSINIPFSTTNKIKGTKTTNYYQDNGQYFFVAKAEKEEVSITNHDKYLNLAFSLTPKISYTFKLANRKVGIYFSRNFALFESAYLPWWSAGLIYYPFKKLT